MKPRNFPDRKERRRRVAQGLPLEGADLRPKDIRFRWKSIVRRGGGLK